jgi:hypothetical protein
MSGIFKLPLSEAELPTTNLGVSKIIYEQHAPRRDVTGSQFPNAVIRYKWETSGGKWWIPQRSYIRMRCTLTSVPANAGVLGAPTMSNDIAPNMNMMGNLFQSMEFRIRDKTVSRIDNYVAEIDALEHRMGHSGEWLRGIGQDLELWSPDQEKRASNISSDGLTTKLVQTRYKPGPPLSTVAVTTAAGVVTGATGTLFTRDFVVGDILEVTTEGVVSSIRMTVIVVTGDTTMTVIPPPSVAIATTVNWNRVRSVSNHSSLQKNQFEVIWKLPLSIWKVTHGIPPGDFELRLVPQTESSYRSRAVESLLLNLRPAGTPTLLNDFDFVVDNMYLYVATVDGLLVDDVTYYLNLDTTNCQSIEINAGAGALQQKNLDVSGSTNGLTVAFADASASSDNTLFSASKFKIRPKGAFSDGAFSLQRLFVMYALQNKPSPDADPDFSGGINYLKQRYADSVLYNNSYFKDAGPETFQEWLDRGMYFYWAWSKDANDRSTRVNINYQLSEDMGNDGRLLLFSHEQKMAIVSVRGGRVVDVVERVG